MAFSKRSHAHSTAAEASLAVSMPSSTLCESLTGLSRYEYL